MGLCCTKTPEPPPGENRQVVVENAAFDSVHAAESSGGETDVSSLASSSQKKKGKKKKGRKKKPSGGKQKKKKKNGKEKQSQQPPPLPPRLRACDRCKSKAQFCNCDADSSHPAQQQQSVPRVQRIVLSSNDLALKCAGLGLDNGHTSYVDSGAAKVKKAIVKLREGKTATAAALAALKKTQHVPQELLELAQGEVLRAIGVTRLGVLNAEVQWKEQGSRNGSSEGEQVIRDRQKLLDTLELQVGFASKLGIATLVEKDAALNAAVDASASAAGSFATTVEIATETGLDMRLVAGVLALREVLSEVAKDAVYFDAGEFDPYMMVEELDKTLDKTDAWYLQASHEHVHPDFTLFKTRLEILHTTATAPHDAAAVAATNALFRIFPGFSTAKLDAMARLVPAILKDVAIYNEIFKAIISSTPQAVFDELKSLAATPSQLPDWESRIKNNAGDPAPDSLEYLMVARHRAADDSITFYTSVQTILTTKLPAGCQAAAMPGLVKAEQRIIFKTALNYSGKGCFSRCNDIVRLTVRVETMEELLMVLISFLGSEDILVLRQKHRLDPDKDMSTIGGYRDYQLLVAFKRDAASVATDGGSEYAVGEIQINLANFIDIKEGVAAGGGGGHGPYKLARSFNGYSPETLVYAGAPSMALAQKIEGGMLLSVTIAGGSESGVDNLEGVGKAMAEALVKPTCRVQELDFGASATEVNVSHPNPKLIAQLLPILPSVVGLTRLDIAGYEGVGLPGSLQGLVKLQTLNLNDCKNLAEPLPDLSHLLPGLEIDVTRKSSDAAIAWSQRGFISLAKTIKMIAMIADGTYTDDVLILAGSDVETLPDSLGKLTHLKMLSLKHCHNLETLPETGVAGLVNLEGLDLRYCSKLKQLPQSIAKLVKLKTLNLGSCSNLETLPETGVAGLVNLEELNLNDCKKLKQLPQSIAKLTKLKTLNLGSCSNLAEPLPDLSHPPPGLEIEMRYASAAAEAWEKRGFTSLGDVLKEIAAGTYADDSLHLGGAHIESLPDSLGKLAHLKTLDLGGCENLETLPDGAVAGLVNLEVLKLLNCSKLKQLPQSIAKLTKLKTLSLTGCKTLEMLPDLSHLLPGLEIRGIAYASDAAQAWRQRGFISLANREKTIPKRNSVKNGERWKVDDRCFAVYVGDGLCYEGTIARVLASECHVIFDGYDDYEVCPLEDIYLMAEFEASPEVQLDDATTATRMSPRLGSQA